MSGFAEFLLAIGALFAAFSCGYLLLLTLLSWRLPIPTPSSRRMCFDVIVPAHNEEAGITRVVQSLLKIDWPKNQFRVLVVADNCSDATAAVARAQAAQVLERSNLALRGKGYALAYAFDWSIKDGFAQAVVVIDADAVVSPNLLEAFAARIERGARAMQASYGVLNPWSSWRTQLLAIAKGAFHTVRSRARERLGVSCGVRGNGWCVTTELLQQIPYEHFSLSEDLEYGIALGLAGCRVQYAGEAHADADMVSNEKNARSQRQRWERGRFELVRLNTWPLLRAAFERRSLVCLDLALDLIVPPLSYVALNIFLLGTLAGLLSIWDAGAALWIWWALACAGVLVLHVLRGWRLSGVGARGLIAFAHVPGFILWRMWLLLARKPQQWVRTERESEKKTEPTNP
jgi:cellulose synthase/poly-beta-1,6-N-acetylglucosamine synthase-like glycosyltransferase